MHDFDLYTEGFAEGRSVAVALPPERLRTMPPPSAANPIMGRALWASADLHRWMQRLPDDAKSDGQRVFEAMGRAWIAAIQAPTRTETETAIAVADTAIDQLAAYARDHGRDTPAARPAEDLDEARALAYATGFLDAVAEAKGR